MKEVLTVYLPLFPLPLPRPPSGICSSVSDALLGPPPIPMHWLLLINPDLHARMNFFTCSKTTHLDSKPCFCRVGGKDSSVILELRDPRLCKDSRSQAEPRHQEAGSCVCSPCCETPSNLLCPHPPPRELRLGVQEDVVPTVASTPSWPLWLKGISS